MQKDALLLNASWVDYTLVAIYFLFVLGIGWAAKSKVSSSIDFFLSGRSLPAWVTGLAFISANLGAVEIVGMSANGVQYGFETMHYFWIGAIPAMVFLGIVMMPFYYDLWQTYMVKDREDDYYTRVGRLATIGATVIAVFTALLVGGGR